MPTYLCAQDVINYFSAESPVELPVTVRSSIGKFVVYHNNSRVDGNLSWVEAYDAKGRRIVDNTPDKTEIGTGKPTVRHYIFKSLYSDNGTSSNSSSYSSNRTQQAVQHGIENVGGTIGRGVGRIWGGSGYSAEGYPNFQIGVGMSYAWGEFAYAKLLYGDSMGFACYGGVGKDWLFDGKNKRLMTWHAGVGFYIACDSFNDEDSDVTVGLTYGNSSAEHDKVLLLDGCYSLFFGKSKRFGLCAGGGLGIGKVNKFISTFTDMDDSVNPSFMWDLRFGLTVKLWSE